MYSRLPLWARVTALLLLTWLLFVADSVVVSACSTIRFVDVSAPGYFKRVVNNPYRPAHARLLDNVRFASIFRFISSSVGRWCDPVLAVPVLFIALVDCLVYLVPRARSVVGNAKQHLRLSGVRPGVEALVELGLGPLPVSCGTKKPVCCAVIGCPGFLVLSAGQQRQVLELALAYLRGSRTGVARPLVNTSFVYEAFRQLQFLDIYPALRTFTLSSPAVPLSRSNTQELDGASGAVVLRAPVSARTMARRKYAPVFPPIPNVKVNTTPARGPACRPTYARPRPATRMGVTGPLLFSVLSFALLACLLAEHETDARPLDALELANEVATLAPQLDLVLAPGSCPSPARASPSVGECS
ncbi:hypothetical protein FRC12_012390 [Ceratobasidium sp. 428]|nr:hypothetical protein FRC12_012390 [Ceratobasidium sp. 428]